MRKWIVIFLISLAVLVASLYILIPNSIFIHKSVTINISQTAIKRLLKDDSNWKKWWPGNDSTSVDKNGNAIMSFNGNTYAITDRKFSSTLLAINKETDTIAHTSLNIVENSKTSVNLDWEAQMLTSSNPFERLKIYLASKKISNDMAALINQMQAFLSSQSNVYGGIDIRQQSVVDSTLISTYDSIKGYPSVEFIYGLIDKLRKYTSSQQAVVTGNPMLNIFTKDSIEYIVKVALPVNKKLPSNGNISYKWMLPGGNILVTEVKGDALAINKAFEQVELFVNDYGRDAPAISFLSLITDRQLEKDSTRWITRIYYPVME